MGVCFHPFPAASFPGNASWCRAVVSAATCEQQRTPFFKIAVAITCSGRPLWFVHQSSSGFRRTALLVWMHGVVYFTCSLLLPARNRLFLSCAAACVGELQDLALVVVSDSRQCPGQTAQTRRRLACPVCVSQPRFLLGELAAGAMPACALTCARWLTCVCAWRDGVEPAVIVGVTWLAAHVVSAASVGRTVQPGWHMLG